MIAVLLLIPIVAALLAAAVSSNRFRPWLAAVAGAAHLVVSGVVIWGGGGASFTRGLALDPPGKIVLLIVSVLFLICAVYAVGYLRLREELSNRVFCFCMLMFLAMTTLVTVAQHLGVMWVAIEATTLTTAPLIYFNHNQRSIEATWKYLLVSSVGIALALLGSFFLAYSAVKGGMGSSLLFDDLLREAGNLSKPWLDVAFVFLLVGYGTKMGLAPMHTWKPDAYSEAPGVVAALLAGVLGNCAFLALVRVDHICRAAGEGAYAGRLLVFMGLFSMGVAAVLMIGQRDLKRMLAYSSVEQMGILALGLGIGGGAILGSLLHMINNGLAKGVLFLSAGNIHRAYDSKSSEEVRGAMRRLPLSGMMFLLGFFAITGSPPFGSFVSQFTIVLGIFAVGRYVVGGIFLLLALIVFIGMGRNVLAAVQGRPTAAARGTRYRDGWLTGLPIVVSLGLLLMMGLHIPGPLRVLVQDAAKFLEVRP